MRLLIKKLLREGLINEGGSSILYHFTNIDRLINILENNEMYLTPTISSSNEKKMSKDKFYFLSLTRTKSTSHGYGTKFKNPNSVRIKFDGSKLTSKYKIVPIDYWQYPKTPDLMKSNIGDEMEDRLVSNKDAIPNITNYIISIDIFVGEEVDDRIIELGKSLGVKINYFNNINDFTSGNESKVVSPKGVKTNKEKRDTRPYEYERIFGALTYKNAKLYQDVMLKLSTDYKLGDDVISKIKDYADDYHKNLDYKLRVGNEWAMEDLAISLSSDLHNSKSSSYPVVRYITSEFIKVYKKLGAKSMMDFFKKLLYLGKKTHEDFNKQFNNDIIKLIDKTYLVELEQNKFGAYDVSGDYWDNIFEEPDIKKFLIGKLNEIKKYVSNFILNNNDMYRLNYVLAQREISDAINLKDDNNLKKILEVFNDVQYDEIIRPIQYVLYTLDEFRNDEITKIQDEYYNQFNK